MTTAYPISWPRGVPRAEPGRHANSPFFVVTTGLYGSGQTDDDAQLDIETAIAAVPS